MSVVAVGSTAGDPVLCADGVAVDGGPTSPSITIPVPVTFNVSSFSRSSTSGGIVPVIAALNCSSRVVRLNNKPNSEGMGPVRKFVPNRISTIDGIKPSSVGKGPSRKFVSKFKVSTVTTEQHKNATMKG